RPKPWLNVENPRASWRYPRAIDLGVPNRQNERHVHGSALAAFGSMDVEHERRTFLPNRKISTSYPVRSRQSPRAAHRPTLRTVWPPCRQRLRPRFMDPVDLLRYAVLRRVGASNELRR